MGNVDELQVCKKKEKKRKTSIRTSQNPALAGWHLFFFFHFMEGVTVSTSCHIPGHLIHIPGYPYTWLPTSLPATSQVTKAHIN